MIVRFVVWNCSGVNNKNLSCSETYSVLVETIVLPSPYTHKVYKKQWLESLDT